MHPSCNPPRARLPTQVGGVQSRPPVGSSRAGASTGWAQDAEVPIASQGQRYGENRPTCTRSTSPPMSVPRLPVDARNPHNAPGSAHNDKCADVRPSREHKTCTHKMLASPIASCWLVAVGADVCGGGGGGASSDMRASTTRCPMLMVRILVAARAQGLVTQC